MRTLLAPSFLTLSISLGLGCDLLDREEPPAAAPGSPDDPVVITACSNVERLVGEPQSRCRSEMGAFLDQCPERRTSVLVCMTAAMSAEHLDSCTKPCMMDAADEIAPPVPPERDTPELAAACVAVGEASGGGTKAGQEGCKRWLAQETAKCPAVEKEVLECYARNAADIDASAECLLRCVEASLRAEKAAEEASAAEADPDEGNTGKRTKAKGKRGKGKRGKKVHS